MAGIIAGTKYIMREFYMKVEPNVVISEFIVNMADDLHKEDNSKVDVAEKVKEQTDSLVNFQVPYY